MDGEKDNAVALTPTVTLAKLYEEQGLLDKAVSVYEKLLLKEPHRDDLKGALEAVKRRQAGSRPQKGKTRTPIVLNRPAGGPDGKDEDRIMVSQEDVKTGKILVLHGPNLNMLGRREPSVYGASTLDEINEDISRAAAQSGMTVETFQSNHEGALVDKIQEAVDGYDALIINPAAYTHTSVAIRDALLMLDVPIIEVHLSNVHKREPFRHKSMIADVATAQIVGFGKAGYTMAVMAVPKMMQEK